ncbi:AAA family ATPase [Plantibacter flavus]|uniref:AAA family ATPase n=1 Tax=Plantibacter flavus TaxID=150123 RepID=UPI003F16FC32
MRLHRLTLQAIGPYAGEHTIDFVELGRAGLFLLEGPTGAGKSTIIDAIVFGLYGELAGTGASKDRLHSHHAHPGVEPFVELVFETGSGVYRVRRTPAYQRPKQRGDGFTPQQASATLVRLTDPDANSGETLSTRAQEIGLEINRIVGLTREQFVQTIVLPQGEFAKFLAAGGEERSDLLRSLFGTEHYERLSKHLVEQRRQAHRDVESAEEALGRAIARFTGAADLLEARQAVAGEDAPDSDLVPIDAVGAGDDGTDAHANRPDVDLSALDLVLTPDSESLLGDAQRIVEALASLATADADRATRARTTLERARHEHLAAEALRSALARRAELFTERELLAVDDEPIAQLAERVAAAVRADTVASALAGAESAARALSEAHEVLEETTRRTSAPVVALDDGALAARREAITVERAGMASILALEAADAHRTAALETLTRQLDDIGAELDALIEAQELRARRRSELSDSAAAVDRATTQLQAARRSVEQQEERTALLDRIERSDDRVARASAGVSSAAGDAKRAVETETALRFRRIDGMAGELAAALHDGEPCMVCGSVNHPEPAALATDHPDADAVEMAASARLAAEEKLQAAQSAHDSARAERAQLIARFLGADGSSAGDDTGADAGADAATDAATDADRSPEPFVVGAARAEVTASAESAETMRAAAATALATAEMHAEEATRLAAEHLAAVVAESELLARRATLTERSDAARTAHEQARTDVARVLDGRADSLAELDAVLERELTELVRLAAARVAVTERSQRDTERAAELRTALDRAGFPDRAAAEAATMLGIERANAEARVEDHRRKSAANASALARPEIAALTGAESVDTEATATRLREAEEEATAATAAAAVSARRTDNARTAAEALNAAAAENAEAVREAAAVIRLADVVSATGSENTTRVTLGTYVLLRRFEDVVAAANARLESMSGGRYELVRSDTKEGPSRSQRVGLSLTVHDHRTDRRRDPKSLSGGETFYASLCLALGLADVVTGEAGGVELGTLFVDEGFGSLDPETLDTVMAELGRLSAGGRVVGVVSHVEEMKQRIGERIEVRRLEDGSSTLLVRA